ncbi:MAG: SulP family inorganic anion transporter [Myxococcaceae bacterium]
MSFFSDFSRRDVLSSFVVFLVALPLCLGVALASGAPPAAGIVTGIVAGVFVGLFGGSPLQVSGPAAGLTVLVWDIVQRNGYGMLGVILLIAGLLQLVAALLRGGRYFQAVPPSVIAGMLAGIGALLLLGQAHVMLGGSSQGSALRNLIALPSHVLELASSEVARQAFIVSFVVIATMAAGPFIAKKLPGARLLPTPLLAIILGSVAAVLGDFSIPHIEVPDRLSDDIALPTVESLRGVFSPIPLGDAAAVAMIASAETLLCASATDRLHDGPRTQFDRELRAQGIGNMICGALGALPMTGVIVRSTANIDAGAKSRWSAVFHGVWLFAVVTLLPWIFHYVPVAALAGLLVFMGYKLLRQDVASLRRGGKAEVVIFLVTLLAIVATDLLRGVAVGLFLAAVRLLWAVTDFRVEMTHPSRERTDLKLFGAATFMRLPDLMAALGAVPRGHEVHVQLDGLSYLDHAALEAIANWEKRHNTLGGKVSLDMENVHHRMATRRGNKPTAKAS